MSISSRIIFTGLLSTQFPRVASSQLHSIAPKLTSDSCVSKANNIGSQLSRGLCTSRGVEDDEIVMASAPPSIVSPREQHKGTVIFFHGLGDQGHGWADVFQTEARSNNIRYVCPHSTSRAVTLNMGMQMPAWYDLYGLDENSPEDEQGIQVAAQYVHQLIDAEIVAGIPSEKIIVGGFSMGAALAIYSALTYPKKLGGIVSLSGFFLQRNKFPALAHEQNKQTPVFLGHGSQDYLVPMKIGKLSETKIKSFNPNVVFKSYPMGHSSCAQELADVKAFIEQKLVQ